MSNSNKKTYLGETCCSGLAVTHLHNQFTPSSICISVFFNICCMVLRCCANVSRLVLSYTLVLTCLGDIKGGTWNGYTPAQASQMHVLVGIQSAPDGLLAGASQLCRLSSGLRDFVLLRALLAPLAQFFHPHEMLVFSLALLSAFTFETRMRSARGMNFLKDCAC